MPKRDRDNLLLTLQNLETELFLSYEDMKLGRHSQIIQQVGMS